MQPNKQTVVKDWKIRTKLRTYWLPWPPWGEKNPRIFGRRQSPLKIAFGFVLRLNHSLRNLTGRIRNKWDIAFEHEELSWVIGSLRNHDGDAEDNVD